MDEKALAKKLRQTGWWQKKVASAGCYYCGKRLCLKDATMDHIVPLSRGGRSTRGNLAPACKACNSQKKSRTATEFIANIQTQP